MARSIQDLTDEELMASDKKTRFKNSSVESDYENVDPALKSIAETIPATITSSYRSPRENAAAGGVPNSYHMQGKALDYRKGELGDNDRKRLASAGFEIIPESDHDHVEPAKGFKASNKPSIQDISDDELLSQDPNRGLMNKPSAIDKGAAFASGVSRAMPATRMAESIGNMIGAPSILEENIKKSPGWGKGGRVTGEIISALPQYLGGMTALESAGYGGVPGIIEKAVDGSKSINWGKLGMNVLKGGAVNAAIGQENRGTKINPAGTAIDALTGGIGEGVGGLVSGGAAHVSDFLKKAGVPDKVERAVESMVPFYGKYRKASREAAEKIAKETFDASEIGRRADYNAGLAELTNDFRVQEGARKSATQEANDQAASRFSSSEAARGNDYQSGVADLRNKFLSQEGTRKSLYKEGREAAKGAVKDLAPGDRGAVGQGVSDAIKESDKQVGKNYAEAVDPIYKKYSLYKGSPQKLRESIRDVFTEGAYFDGKGNIDINKIQQVIAPERKKMFEKLYNISHVLKRNPSIQKMREIVQDLQSMGFQNEIPTKEDAVFRKLARSAKESFLDSLEKVAAPEEVETVKGARKAFSERQPIFEELRPLANQHPEKIVSSGAAKIPGTFATDIIEKEPGLKKAISDLALSHLAQKGTTPQMLTKAMDQYGRDALKQILGPDELKSLLSAENGMKGSFQPFERSIAPEPIPFKAGIPPEIEPFEKALAPKAIPFKSKQQPPTEYGKIKDYLKFISDELEKPRMKGLKKKMFMDQNDSLLRLLGPTFGPAGNALTEG